MRPRPPFSLEVYHLILGKLKISDTNYTWSFCYFWGVLPPLFFFLISGSSTDICIQVNNITSLSLTLICILFSGGKG
jgi:hypothetical protein